MIERFFCWMFGHEWFQLNYWPNNVSSCERCGSITQAAYFLENGD